MTLREVERLHALVENDPSELGLLVRKLIGEMLYAGVREQRPEFADDGAELVWAIESPDRSRLYYQAEDWRGILNAAAAMRDDFPGEEFIVTRGGAYDAQATLDAQEGLAV